MHFDIVDRTDATLTDLCERFYKDIYVTTVFHHQENVEQESGFMRIVNNSSIQSLGYVIRGSDGEVHGYVMPLGNPLALTKQRGYDGLRRYPICDVHSKGIVSGDIKLDGILLCRPGALSACADMGWYVVMMRLPWAGCLLDHCSHFTSVKLGISGE
jgi:hypothetical protein